MAVLPKQADVDKYLTDAVSRHDHKALPRMQLLQTITHKLTHLSIIDVDVAHIGFVK